MSAFHKAVSYLHTAFGNSDLQFLLQHMLTHTACHRSSRESSVDREWCRQRTVWTGNGVALGSAAPVILLDSSCAQQHGNPEKLRAVVLQLTHHLTAPLLKLG